MRDGPARRAVEQILRSARHRDRFRAVEFVTRWAADAERLFPVEAVVLFAEKIAQIVHEHVREPERVAAIRAAFDAAIKREREQGGDREVALGLPRLRPPRQARDVP